MRAVHSALKRGRFRSPQRGSSPIDQWGRHDHQFDPNPVPAVVTEGRPMTAWKEGSRPTGWSLQSGGAE